MQPRNLDLWLTKLFVWLRVRAPAWPPLIGFEGVDAEPDEETRRWLDRQKQILPYLHWPNI
jgi:hypothetical protein